MQVQQNDQEQWQYIGSRGEPILIKDMVNTHLLNTYAKALTTGESQVADVMRYEIERRLQEGYNGQS